MAIFASCSVQFRSAVLCCCRRWPPSACLQTPICAPPSRKSRLPSCSCSVTWPFSRPLVRASGPLWHPYQTCGPAALVCPFSMSALSHSAGHMPVLHACFVLARDCSGQWGHLIPITISRRIMIFSSWTHGQHHALHGRDSELNKLWSWCRALTVCWPEAVAIVHLKCCSGAHC